MINKHIAKIFVGLNSQKNKKQKLILLENKMNLKEFTKFNINYSKIKQIDLKYLEEKHIQNPEDLEHNYNPFQISNLQNYNPIYSDFFTMNENNYQRISLNNIYSFKNMNTVYNSETKEAYKKSVFIKYAPLLDPIRYMIGKYDINDNGLRTLPNLLSNDKNTFPKLLNKHNTSYVDNFFSYLTSKLLHQHGFIHGLDYYGSFLGIQKKFKVNIYDDLEYLNDSDFFLKNVGKHFYINKHEDANGYLNFGSRANKNRLKFSQTNNIHNLSAISLANIENNENCFEDLEEVYEKPSSKNISSSSSSQSSDSTNDSNLNYSSEEDGDEGEDGDDESDNRSSVWETDSEQQESSIEEEDEANYAYINDFPVQMICLEKCDGTLDELFLKKQVDEENGSSILFQIIMTLLTYQKAFHFTHNDLHTNNIMYVKTDIEYIYYKYSNKIYKVPTYGKIFKLIDFGRGIYKFQGKLFCSDSFSPGNDAHTQYNTEPFINENKPRLEPNYSFDLCRLATSIYDFVIDGDEKPNNMDEFQKIIARLCKDDNNKNLLYMRDGRERYEGFRLYKMIARTVHNCIPEEQLDHYYFNQYEVLSIDGLDKHIIINIDSIPCYVN